VEKEENTTLEAQEKKDETAFQVTEEFLGCLSCIEFLKRGKTLFATMVQ
jgi:hypothetical protein